jgi:predicted amidohydrolase
MSGNLPRRSFLGGVTAGGIGLALRTDLIGSDEFHGLAGGMPEGWQVRCPNPALAPKFRLVERTAGRLSLSAEGNGRRECFGYIRRAVALEGGRTYRLHVELGVEGLDDLNRHLRHGVFGRDFNDGIFDYRRAGDRIVGENRFPGPEQSLEAELRLYYRFSANGRVWWDRVRLEECEPVAPRPVSIACREGGLPKGAGLSYWENWLDEAGRRKVDVALLPETYNGKSPSEAESLDGPAGNLLARKAEQWGMYTCASFYEKRGDLVYNTAPLFDRRGKLAGTYEKCYPYDPELDGGVTPGTRFPVFQTDFGKLGIMICYDSWFPEAARVLALNGAELVLFPNAAYYVDLMPARAADNGLWIAVSSLQSPGGIWDSSGTRAGEASPSETRFAASTIRAYAVDAELNMVTARVDLSRRFSPHWWGGPMASAPGGRRVRRTSIGAVEDEAARLARRWWTD